MEYIKKMPLNDSQMGIYLECLNDENSLKYNLTFENVFDMETDAVRLCEACNRVLSNYAAFSCGVVVENGSPMLVMQTDKCVSAAYSEMTEEKYSVLKPGYAVPFVFDGSPLCRMDIIKTEKAVYLLYDIHHIIFDGVSTKLFETALELAYQGKPLPPETVSIFDAAREEMEQNDEQSLSGSYEFYEKLLSNPDADSNLIPDISSGSTDSCSVYSCEMDVPAEKIREFAKKLGVTENVVLLSAFSYALAKYSGQNDAIFSSINSGRRGLNLDNTMGFFVRTFPLYFTIDEESTVSEYIKYVKSTYFAVMSHDEVSFSKLADRFSIRSDIKYVYQGGIMNGYTFNGKPVEKNYFDCDDALSNLDVMIYSLEDRFLLHMAYRNGLYSLGNVRSFAGLFSKVASEMLRAEKLRDIILVDSEADSFINGFNSSEKPYDRQLTVWDYLGKKIAEYGEKTAVSYKERSITYSEFDILTSKLAAYISSKGIGAEDFVAVLIPRNEYMPVTAWGIVRAGAAYLPLDPTYPAERLGFMVRDAGAKLLIADRSLRSMLAEYDGPVLYTDEIDSLPHSGSFKPLDTPESALVIIYTSGTTGTPKGCILENRNIACFNLNHAEVMGLDENSNVATYASFGFDAGIMDIFTTLMEGAALYVIPDEIRLDILKINEFYKENKITHGFITTQVGRMFAEITDCSSIKSFMVGGEKLVPFNPPKGFSFINGYGPSETIAYVCHHTVTDDSSIQPIGTPMGNMKLYVADRFDRLLPPGACGELCISGGQVGRGYLNRPDKTAEVFVANPFCHDSGYERMYKTGDVVRLLPSGELEFIGRRDGQVKIRGFRVELTEVEKVIRDFPGIRNANVQAFDSPSGGKYIAAYVVSDNCVDTGMLSEFIRSRKPDYMVPETIMQLDDIPVNANGKVDRRKLPVPEKKAENIRLPENEMQKRILDRAAEVIGTDSFGIDTPLFNVGLSSLGVIKLNVLLAEEFGVSLTIKDLRRNDTVEKLADFITGLNSPEEKVEVRDYPLTKNQEGIYIECISNPGSTNYNVPLLLKIDDGLKITELKKAIVSAVNAHSYMLTSLFTAEDGSVRQRQNSESFSADAIEEIYTDSIETVRDTLIQPFELVGGKLLRVRIIHADGLYLFLDVHHIISDGTSVNILLEDISRAYEGIAPVKESFTGYDVSEAEKRSRTDSELKSAKEHFDRLFADADGDFLPGSDRYPDSPFDSGCFDENSSDGLPALAEAFCKKNGLSMNALMVSVFGYVLAEYNAEDYSVFTTIYNGRNDSRTFRTFAMLVKTLPVFVNTAYGSPAELVRAVSDELLDSMINDVYSFSEISREYGIHSDVMFIWQGSDFGFESFCGRKAEKLKLNLNDKKTPISIEVYGGRDSFVYHVDYDNTRFTEKLIRSLTDAFNCALESFVSCDSLRDVSLVSRDMLRTMDEYNETDYPIDDSQTMSSRFEAIAEKYPGNTAVVCGDKRISYSELESLTASLASCLNSKGIGRGDFVPVLVDRNEYMAVASWGVIRSGAAYEPLDPAYPVERLRFMLSDTDAAIMIADRQLSHIIDNLDIEVIYTDEISELPKVSGYRSEAEPDDPFIIVYTSGTTGQPKGNVLAHRHPVSMFDFHIRDAKLTPESRTAYFTGFSFDAGMLDLHAPLLSGGTLYVITEELRLDLKAMDEYFCENGITHSSMTTQMGSLFVQSTKCSTLEYFTVGGEKLVPFVPPKHIRFVNGYGPSECTVYSSGYDVVNDALLQPVGKPHSNLRYYITDKLGRRLPIGAAGELCIAGRQVGLGYRNRPEKTAEVFTSNPFSSDAPYSRLYHTGDIVRELPDGNYDFVGRKDGQVKIRGYRVELTEVEQIIRSYEGVKNATVQAFSESGGAKYIAAYVVSDSKVDFQALSRFIGESKPSYMIPAAYMQLEKIPLTANGKVDKRALPIPERAPQTAGIEPADETEEIFCDIFAETLGLEKVYADDDFFLIGGSSITAAQAVVKCDAAGFNIVFKNFFDNPTPQKLARFVNGAKAEDILAPSGAEKEKYDYSCLEYNVPENLPKIKYLGVGDVLLTGVTGYLGSHVFKALIEKTQGKVICLVRNKKGMSSQTRFEMMMTYYFDDWYSDEFAPRTVIVDGDLSDTDIDEKLKGISFDTIINCAANVKHFAYGDSLVKDNFESVEHLISLAEKNGAKLVQASSLSVCGESVNGSIPMDFKFRENNLNIGQSLENKYVYSKYLAEQAIIDATSRGRIRGKIIRFGNLAARESDGEYQINASNSGLLKLIQGYIKLGCYPVDVMDAGIEFSPIDKVAEAMVLLSGTPDEFTVFHAKNCHEIHYGYFINALKAKGHKIDIIERDEFEERFRKALEEEDDITDFTGFIAYLNRTDASVTDMMIYNDDESNSEKAVKEKQYETRIKVSSDTAFTTKALYRLGFAWPITGREYLENMVDMLDEKAFF